MRKGSRASAVVDLVGLVLPLVGSLYLSFETIPLVLGSILTDTKGNILLDAKGNILTGEPDPLTIANHALYVRSAIVANLIVFAGVAVQARGPLRRILPLKDYS